MDSKKFVKIMPFMVEELGLKGNELIIYAIIYSFSSSDCGRYSGGIEYLMQWTSLSKQGVINVLQSLRDKGLIARLKRKTRFDYTVGTELDEEEPKVKKVDLESQKTLPNNEVSKVKKVDLSEESKVKKVDQVGKKTLPNRSKKLTQERNLERNIKINNIYTAGVRTHVREVMELVKELSPVLYERHCRNASNDYNLHQLLEECQYTIEEVRELVIKANKTYIVLPKYRTLDLIWVLNNKGKVEAADVIDNEPSTGTTQRESVVSQMARIRQRLEEEDAG